MRDVVMVTTTYIRWCNSGNVVSPRRDVAEDGPLWGRGSRAFPGRFSLFKVFFGIPTYNPHLCTPCSLNLNEILCNFWPITSKKRRFFAAKRVLFIRKWGFLTSATLIFWPVALSCWSARIIHKNYALFCIKTSFLVLKLAPQHRRECVFFPPWNT